MAYFLGSIVINFWASGTQSGVTAVIDSVAGSLTNGTFAVALPGGSFSMDAYLMVDGSVYNGLSGSSSYQSSTEQTSTDPGSKQRSSTAAIIAGSIVGVLVVAIIIFVVIIIIKKNKSGR